MNKQTKSNENIGSAGFSEQATSYLLEVAQSYAVLLAQESIKEASINREDSVTLQNIIIAEQKLRNAKRRNQLGTFFSSLGGVMLGIGISTLAPHLGTREIPANTALYAITCLLVGILGTALGVFRD